PVSESPVAWAPTLAAPPGPAPRRRLLIAGVAAGVLGVVAIVALASRGDPHRRPTLASAQPALATSQPAVAPSAVAGEPGPPPATPPSPAAPPSNGPEPAAQPPATPPTIAPPTVAPPTIAPPTVAPPTIAPPTIAPPTIAPPTIAPPTIADPARGTLTVATRANAVVYLDGVLLDHGSFADRAAGAGKHKLVVKIPGRRPVTRTITIEPNRETKVEIEAPASPVAVREPAPSHPSGASSGASTAGPATRPAPGDPPHDRGRGPSAKASDPSTAGGKGRPDGSKPGTEDEKPDVAAAKPTIDVAATRAAARTQLRPVLQCYERGKMDDPNLRGSVTVRITIAEDGSVANAQVTSSTLGSPQVEACITREVAHWQLPRPPGGGPVSLSYPFAFE
ncbi:MAG TPA: TonB family protein, partial [Kofleriaceae bacterium]|nr:TonB family protein [Kofleriaceae bacterium]